MPRPVVAIVGRPNVGKSALFNRLIRQRLSIVENTPGVTRDRVYARCDLYRRTCTLVDTGGLDPSEKNGLITQVAAQAKLAISEANAILFAVDARESLTSTDFQIAELLRTTRKPVLLVANKLDKAELPPPDLYELQLGEPVSVSSLHGLNFDRIIDWLEAVLPEREDVDLDDASVKIAIIGRPNVGKSALLNAALGQERSIVSESPGTTRDSIDTSWIWQGQPITLIDTAGMRKRGKVKLSLEYYCVLRALRSVDRADVVFLVLDHEGPMEQDAKIAGYAHEAGKAMVIVANKWDLLEKSLDTKTTETRQKLRHVQLLQSDYVRMVRLALPFAQYAPVVFTSAIQREGISDLMKAALSVYAQNTQRIATGPLNRLMAAALLEKPPSPRKGRHFRLYYAAQVATAPPTFVLFVSDPDAVHFSYLRYLENQIRKAFDFEGTPLRITLRRREREGEGSGRRKT